MGQRIILRLNFYTDIVVQNQFADKYSVTAGALLGLRSPLIVSL